MSAVPVPKVTPEEYLAVEREADTKHEYVNGEVYAMAGGTTEHNQIVGNLIGEIHPRLKGKPCRVFPSDLRLQITETGLYTYPDVMVICGDLRYADDKKDTVTNPKVIFEVLSETTELKDRGWKWRHYRLRESLAEFVMVAQDRMHVEHYVRQPDGWLLREYCDLNDTLRLPSIGCEVPLADIYYRVPLDAAGEAAGP